MDVTNTSFNNYYYPQDEEFDRYMVVSSKSSYLDACAIHGVAAGAEHAAEADQILARHQGADVPVLRVRIASTIWSAEDEYREVVGLRTFDDVGWSLDAPGDGFNPAG